MAGKVVIGIVTIQKGPLGYHRIALSPDAYQALDVGDDNRVAVSKVDGGLLLQAIKLDTLSRDQLLELLRLPTKRGPKPGSKRRHKGQGEGVE